MSTKILCAVSLALCSIGFKDSQGRIPISVPSFNRVPDLKNMTMSIDFSSVVALKNTLHRSNYALEKGLKFVKLKGY